MQRNIFLVLAISCWCLITIAQGYEDELIFTRDIPSTRPNEAQSGFIEYFSFGAGYGDSAGSDNDKAEVASSSFKFLGSYITPNRRFVFDAGFGLQSHNFVHGLAKDKSISPGVMEVAARYQFKNHWQIGAVYNQVFNAGENFYADQADVQFGAAQILREFPVAERYIGRVGGRFMHGINIKNEVFNMAMIDFQISWPVF